MLKKFLILVTLSGLPIFSWFFLVLAPILILAALALVPVAWLIIQIYQTSPAEARPDALPLPQVPHTAHAAHALIRSNFGGHEPVLLLSKSGDFLRHWNEILRAHLAQFSTPIRACSCLGTRNGGYQLATRITAAGGSWSHLVHGPTLEDAVSRAYWKLTKESARFKSAPNLEKCGIKSSGGCGIFSCGNYARCPYRTQAAHPYTEIARVEAFAS